MNILDLLRERHGLQLPDNQLQKIVETCAEIIVVQDQQTYEDEMRAAIDSAGGCSACGDLDGYSCTCEDEHEYEDNFYECEGCDGHPACEDFGCAIKAGIPINSNHY